MRWILTLVLAVVVGCTGSAPREQSKPEEPNTPSDKGFFGAGGAPGATAFNLQDEKVQALLKRMKKLCDERNYDLAWEVANEICQKVESLNLEQIADIVLGLALTWALNGAEIPDAANKLPEFWEMTATAAHNLGLPRHEFAALALLYAVNPTADIGKRVVRSLIKAKQGTVIVGDGRKVNLLDKYVAHYAKKWPDDVTGRLFRARLQFLGRRFTEAGALLKDIHTAAAAGVSENSVVLPEICYWKARVELNQGEFDAASATAKQGIDYADAALKEINAKIQSDPTDDLWRDRQEVVWMNNELMQVTHDCLESKRMGIHLSFTAPEFLPLGFYHLMSEAHGPLSPFLELHVINGDERDKTVIFTSEVVDVTYKSIDQFVLPAKAPADKKRLSFNMRIYQTPPIRASFKVNEVVESVERPIKITVVERFDAGDKVLLTRTIPVSIWPRTRFVQRLPTKGGDMIVTNNALAAWVTPRGRWVQDAIKGAKKYLAKDLEFYGVGAANVRTADQVRAIYDYLKKDKKLSYVGTAIGLEKGCFYQEVRLPADIMESSNNLCIEGTVTFATLIEAIGLEPAIILLPGHAIVGWFDDKGPCSYKGRKLYVLETTVIYRADFDQALGSGESTWNKEKIGQKVNKMVYDVLELRMMRERGYLPQPFPERE